MHEEDQSTLHSPSLVLLAVWLSVRKHCIPEKVGYNTTVVAETLASVNVDCDIVRYAENLQCSINHKLLDINGLCYL